MSCETSTTPLELERTSARAATLARTGCGAAKISVSTGKFSRKSA
jgi:hypothetical protein